MEVSSLCPQILLVTPCLTASPSALRSSMFGDSNSACQCRGLGTLSVCISKVRTAKYTLGGPEYVGTTDQSKKTGCDQWEETLQRIFSDAILRPLLLAPAGASKEFGKTHLKNILRVFLAAAKATRFALQSAMTNKGGHWHVRTKSCPVPALTGIDLLVSHQTWKQTWEACNS